MSERSLFSFRWAVPGYTFLLFLTTLNYRVILGVMQRTFEASSFFGFYSVFLVILSGSAIGFFVAHSWYSWCRGSVTVHGVQPNTMKVLQTRYGLINSPKKKQKERIVVMLSYIINSQAEKHKNLVDYSTRRWDLFNLFGIVKHSLAWSLVLGLTFRIITHFFLGIPFDFQLDWEMLETTEFWVLSVTIITIITLLRWDNESMKRVINQYDIMTSSLVRTFDIRKKNVLMTLFGEDLFLSTSDS